LIDSAVNEAAGKLAELRERGRGIADARVRPDVFGDDVSPEAKERLRKRAEEERYAKQPDVSEAEHGEEPDRAEPAEEDRGPRAVTIQGTAPQGPKAPATS